MTEFEYLGHIHKALSRALDAEQDTKHRAHLYELKAATWQRAQRARLNGQPAIIFANPMPGYWLIAEADRAAIYPDPGLAGLAYGWDIHCAGPTARSILHSSCFGPSPNALRNRLKASADWVERTTGCWPLAAALRQPAITISNDGTIDLDASRLPEIRLMDW